ncbi:hypothetical protein LJC32_02035 [Oscillospiraceae bacterium OttesenSCG-928-F05]|nr:hypothetical protein [Oscillospiraceae bacterium OttesenSCG-928-F05]
MKTVYIPAGQSIVYSNLDINEAVVHGTLSVQGLLRAGKISGKGCVVADEICSGEIAVRDLRANKVVCERMAVDTASVSDCAASDAVTSAVHFEANTVKAAKLVVVQSTIETADVGETIVVSPKRRSMFGVIVRAAVRSWWISLARPGTILKETAPEASAEQETEEAQASDRAQYDTLIDAIHMLKQSGIRVEITPIQEPPSDAFEQASIFDEADAAA